MESNSLTPARIKQLRKINERLHVSRTRAQRIKLDLRFHEGLTQGCANKKLQQLLQDVRPQAARYEWIYGEHETIEPSFRDHEKVLDQLARGHQGKSAALLERHQVGSLPTLLEFLRARHLSFKL